MEETREFSGLENLKIEYNLFKEKYNLPEFTEMNKIFDIEEIDTDTEFLIRKIRRLVSERIISYLRFVEIILNPSNAPMFFFKIIKKLDSDDKKNLSEIYEKLGALEIKVIELDLNYSEEKEAEFIIEIYNVFNQELKENLLKIVHKLGNGENKQYENNGSYFG